MPILVYLNVMCQLEYRLLLSIHGMLDKGFIYSHGAVGVSLVVNEHYEHIKGRVLYHMKMYPCRALHCCTENIW